MLIRSMICEVIIIDNYRFVNIFVIAFCAGDMFADADTDTAPSKKTAASLRQSF